MQDAYNLKDILDSFGELPDGQLLFSLEELYKATTMRKTVSALRRFRCGAFAVALSLWRSLTFAVCRGSSSLSGFW